MQSHPQIITHQTHSQPQAFQTQRPYKPVPPATSKPAQPSLGRFPAPEIMAPPTSGYNKLKLVPPVSVHILEELPYELRELIFHEIYEVAAVHNANTEEQLLQVYWIKAFQPLSITYEHALKWYLANVEFHLYGPYDWKLQFSNEKNSAEFESSLLIFSKLSLHLTQNLKPN